MRKAFPWPAFWETALAASLECYKALETRFWGLLSSLCGFCDFTCKHLLDLGKRVCAKSIPLAFFLRNSPCSIPRMLQGPRNPVWGVVVELVWILRFRLLDPGNCVCAKSIPSVCFLRNSPCSIPRMLQGPRNPVWGVVVELVWVLRFHLQPRSGKWHSREMRFLALLLGKQHLQPA